MKMIKYNIQSKLIFYYLALILFLLLTNEYFDYQESIINGAADGQAYFNISNSFPKIADQQMASIHSERFFFYYIFGFLSKISNFEIFNIYRFFVCLILISINIILILILKKKKIDLNIILFFLTLVNLNPYMSRFYIAAPSVLNDLIFIFGLTLFLYSVENNKTKILIYSLIILFFSRQTSVAIILSLILTKFTYQEKFIFTKKKIFFMILLCVFIYLINYQYSENTFKSGDLRWELYSPKMRLFGYFLQDVNIKEKLIFLILPLLSFFPLIMYFLIFRKLKKIQFSLPTDPKIFFYFLISLFIIFQPILSGVSVTGRNIIRLTTLSYIVVLYLLLNFTTVRKLKNKSIGVFFYLFIIFWSFHPTFSNIKVFEPFAMILKKNF